MDRHDLDLLNLQILAERAVHEKILRMRELESQLSAQSCRVCGDRASGRHYGVQSCDGCRGFFKRSVRRNIGYTCKYNNSCVVDMKRRNQCQFCRFQRCLVVGMNKHAVQHERLPRKQRQLPVLTATYPQRQFEVFPNGTPAPQMPNIADSAEQSPANSPGMASLWYYPHSPVGSPLWGSPTFVPHVPRYALLPPHPPHLVPPTMAMHPSHFSFHHLKPEPLSMPHLHCTPAPDDQRSLCITENTPPSDVSSPKSSTPNSPYTPSSKKTSEYSIESLLKVADDEKRKAMRSSEKPIQQSALSPLDNSVNCSSMHSSVNTSQEVHLTPPNTPPSIVDASNSVPQYQRQVQTSLVQILSSAITRVNNIPAFRELSGNDKRILLSESWLQIFLIALYEFDFPIESLSVYLQSVSNEQPNLPKLDEVTVKQIEQGLLKLKELKVDRTETAYVKALALFANARLSPEAKEHVEKVQEQAQCMLVEYDRTFFPDTIARNGKVILALTNLQKLDKTVARLLFPDETVVEAILSKFH